WSLQYSIGASMVGADSLELGRGCVMRMERGDKAATLLAGIGLGAALMYFLDPQRGNARRAVARDRANAALRDARLDLENRRRDLRNRFRGAAAEIRSASSNELIDDVLLVERVRAELGH